MFTGIIKEIGAVEKIIPKGRSRKMSIKAASLSENARIGDSISVDGVCLTVVDKTKDILFFDLMEETCRTTTLGYISAGERVNLEPPLALNGTLSGHLVTGHIDEVGLIRKIKKLGDQMVRLEIGINSKKSPLLVQKGSVAVNGTSLTVNGVGCGYFIVDIIPHTYKATTIGKKRIGDRVNIEYDIIGKYVLRSLSASKRG